MGRSKFASETSLEIAVTADYVDLSKRDVDVVIRATSSPPEHLVVRNAGPWGLAAYASKRYFDRMGRNRPLADYEWLPRGLGHRQGHRLQPGTLACAYALSRGWRSADR